MVYIAIIIGCLLGALVGINSPIVSYTYSNYLAIAIIAALNLIIDFDFIEKGVRTPMPAVMEWYGAFGLLVTIIWLYVEILRILSRVRSR